MIMPVTSTQPILFRAAAPGPVTKTKGKCPATVATEVIRIGGKRLPAASNTALNLSNPF